MHLLARALAVMVLALLALPAASAASAASAATAASRWRAAVQTAPGRVVLPLNGNRALRRVGDDIVVAGLSRTRTLVTSRLGPDGRLDPSYGDGGVAITAIALRPTTILPADDGTLLVLGSSAGGTTLEGNWQIVRLLPSGAPDPGFGNGGLVELAGMRMYPWGPSLAPQPAPGGDIVLPTVTAGAVLPPSSGALVRVKRDGTPDPAFDARWLLQLPGGPMYVQAFAVQPDGSVIAVASNVVLHPRQALLVRLTPSGALDPSFGGGAPVPVAAGVSNLFAGADGTITLVTDLGDPLQHSGLVRYTPDGRLDRSWGANGVTDIGGRLVQSFAPSADGSMLLVGFASALPSTSRQEQILRIDAGGRIDPSVGGASGLQITQPFGGGEYRPGAIANLRQNSFQPDGVIQRRDGTLLFAGDAGAMEATYNEGGMDVTASAWGLGLAALDPSFAPDRSFGGASSLRLGARVVSTRLTANGIAVRITSPSAALSVTTVRALGRTIARGTVPLLVRSPADAYSLDNATTRVTARIPLTRAGRRLLRGHRPLRAFVTVNAADIAGNRVAARASRLLRRR